MKMIYCSNPLSPNEPDSDYELEVLEAESLGIDYYLISFENLLNGNSEKALRKLPELPVHELSIFRGWMLKPDDYHLLFNSLFARGYNLINDPHSYQHCHYLPESYHEIAGFTPESVWFELPENKEINFNKIMEILVPFGNVPLILKDYVKSRKHDWYEACYIPSALARNEVERVVKKFIELQGNELNKGLVFRKFMELNPLVSHSKSGMPLTMEYRLFYLDGKLLYWAKYWNEGNYQNIVPPVEKFTEIAAKVKSRFFTMDIARLADGDWTIVELGDAQVSGLPETSDIHLFYERLKHNLPD